MREGNKHSFHCIFLQLYIRHHVKLPAKLENLHQILADLQLHNCHIFQDGVKHSSATRTTITHSGFHRTSF
jgi:hypothetical protein